MSTLITDTTQIVSFGYSSGKDNLELDWKGVAKRVSLLALSIIAGCAVGFAIGNIIGAVIGGFIGFKIGTSTLLIEKARLISHENQFNPTIPAAQIYSDRAQIKVGEESLCNLLVSNNVAETLEHKKTLIKSAETSLELSPNFAGGEEFQDILNLIEEQMKKKPALRVHLIVSEDLLTKENITKIQSLDSGFTNRFKSLITKRIFCTRPFLHTEENHVKMLVVDGKYFAMGGAGVHKKMATEDSNSNNNISTTFAERFIDKAFRDTDLIGEGEVAQTMRAQFFALFRKWENRMAGIDRDRFFTIQPPTTEGLSILEGNDKLKKDVKIKFLVGGPEHREHNPITEEYAKLIQQSKKCIKIANLLFNPPKIIIDALKQKKQEGVYREGYFNGTGSNSSAHHYIYALPNRSNYHLFNKVNEYVKKETLYHKKVATFDSRYAIVGSYNLGIKSALCDDEIACVIEDEEIVKDIDEGLGVDAKVSKKYESTRLTLKQAVSAIPSQLAIAALGPYFG